MRRLRSYIAVLAICGAGLLSVGSGKSAVQIADVVVAVTRVAVELAVLIAIVSQDADMYVEPESRYVICHVPARTQVKIKTRTPDSRWVKVQIPDGREGWMSTRKVPIPRGKDVPVDKAQARQAAQAAASWRSRALGPRS